MKLRNKKTGDVWEFDEGLAMKASYETAKRAGAISGSLTCYANSIAELKEDWEDVIPKEYSKYYLINEETGYIATFDSEREMKIFQNEIDGWKPVKVLLDD